MILPTENAITVLTLVTLLVFGLGIVVLNWGKKLPGRGVWLVWVGLLILLAGVGYETGIFQGLKFSTKIWMVGWIWSKNEPGAITIGVLHDVLGLTIGVLAALMAGALLLNHGTISQEPRAEKAYAGLAISIAGVTLAWNSVTPWFALCGMVLTFIGGFSSFGCRWESNEEASLAARFMWERSFGLLFTFFGACILISKHSSLWLHPVGSIDSQLSAGPETFLGALLFVSGLFVQTQPFPLLGWLVSESETYHPIRALLTQIFPAWTAFALVLRLEPELINLGIFPNFGWIALGSAVLSILCGLLQKQWKKTVGLWLASGLSLSFALLAFCGSLSAISLLLGVSLGIFVVCQTASGLECDCSQNPTHKKKAIWLKIATFFGCAAGSGVLGFLPALGLIRWISEAINIPGAVASFLIVLFLFVLLGWRTAWKVTKIQNVSNVSWVAIFSSYFLILLCLGVVWTGTVSGGALQGQPDRLFRSVFDLIFDAKMDSPFANDFVTSISLYLGTSILAFLSAFWISGGKEDRWSSLNQLFPKLTQFISNGYYIDGLGVRLTTGLSVIGKTSERLIDQKIWNQWVPDGLSHGINRVTDHIAKIDHQISFGLGRILGRLIEVPAKLLQLIQTGDIRWYLFFALGSGFALLSHFLKI